jgi:hypothetical protein
MAEFAKKIVVRQVYPTPNQYQRDSNEIRIEVPVYAFEIDGVEFPWYISEDGVRPEPAQRHGVPGVTITILADRVEFVHALSGGEAE